MGGRDSGGIVVGRREELFMCVLEVLCEGDDIKLLLFLIHLEVITSTNDGDNSSSTECLLSGFMCTFSHHKSPVTLLL